MFLGERVDADGKGVRNKITSMDFKCVKFKTGVDATDWMNLTYENGQKAYLKTSMVSPTHNEGVIYGTSGQIRVQNLNDMVKIELCDDAGNVVESVEPSRLCNCYEYEVLACKEAIENPLQFRHEICEHCSRGFSNGVRSVVWERPEMTHAKTMEFMTLMDKIREQFGVRYPFED